MNVALIPWKETLLILLLMLSIMSMNHLELRARYIRDITTHPWVRFIVLFLTAFMLFSLDINGNYSITIRLIVAAVVAFIIQRFIAANMRVIPLTPIVKAT